MDPIKRILAESKTIAVVGASANPERPSYAVARYLQASGYRMIPVNPALDELLGEHCYPDVRSIPILVDMVDIFRRPDAVPDIVAQAIEKQVRTVWMQPGAENPDAAASAEAAGLEVIMGVCVMNMHRDFKGGSEAVHPHIEVYHGN